MDVLRSSRKPEIGMLSTKLFKRLVPVRDTVRIILPGLLQLVLPGEPPHVEDAGWDHNDDDYHDDNVALAVRRLRVKPLQSA